ncbi:dihydroorotate dehydrogenase (quinone), mitochondrial-like isoform X3 [Varroa jacobsoni]|nr:dihydroorotate dehydrogenase (quinone), mitochondrial-like isoform X2 [Varroa destructor]XP_022648703.1 dihydroorotate dehydrogenase (quinone), mitochondrial-like isoform X2 [Varroa destructor]XP_022690747.1 dihydroorotate dehydrogenase (quinone), mitochondrial-like isoform X3 [Varroa jacobsoni]
MPMVHRTLEPENAHRAGVLLAKYRILPNWNTDYPELKTRLFGIDFRSCVGLAAGFDKDGEAVNGLFDWGFGFVEVGSVTPMPQPGNERPRVFRLPKDQAIINRYGFNSCGHEELDKTLFSPKRKPKEIVGINLGKNKTSEDAAADYSKGVLKFGEKADYLVVNISSPNTSGLRQLQSKNQLKELLSKVISTRNSLSVKVPILLKIAPDLSDEDKKDIAEVILMSECQVDGLIISNTTIRRPKELASAGSDEIGGLSGKPIHALSTVAISDMFLLTKGKIPIIGVGGISTGEEAYAKIKAGASMVQVLTTLIYRGPPVVETIKAEMVKCLKEDGYTNVTEAVGADHQIDAIVSKLITIK